MRERIRWAWRATPELHNWRRATAEGGLAFVASLLILRTLLDPQGWRDEVVVTAVSLTIGLVPPVVRMFVNYLRAPRGIVEVQFLATWHAYTELKTEWERLLGEKLDVEIGGIFSRGANLPGARPDSDGVVYALQDTIITNRSDDSVSLSFELWLPWTKQAGAWFMVREQEHSGLGRSDPRYARSPINIGPRASSECKDIGFLSLPGDSIVFGDKAEYDLKRAVLRVIDRISRKTMDVPVRQRTPVSNPPGAS